MRQFIIPKIVLLILLTIGVAGCPMMQFSHPVLVAKDIFRADPQWPDKRVCYIYVVEPNASPQQTDKAALTAAFIGPCCDSTQEQFEKNYSKFTLVWAIKAVEPVAAKDVQFSPGRIPHGFTQTKPVLPAIFNPDPDKLYQVLVCLDPVSDEFYSVAVEWKPGQEIAILRDTKTIGANGPFSHVASGMVFPTYVAGFTRAEIRNYDQAGRNTGVGYNLENPSALTTATVYIYPASIDSPQEDFDVAKKSILFLHKDARLIKDQTVSLRQRDADYAGRMATFEFEDIFIGRRQPVKSHLYVFSHPGGKWIIKYRFTHSKDADSEGFIKEFMDNLPWPAENSN